MSDAFPAVVRTWLAAQCKRWSPQYQLDVAFFVRQWCREWPEAAPTIEEVERYVAGRRRSGSRLNTERACFVAMCRWAATRRLLISDPSAIWEPVRRNPKKEPTSFSPEEERALLSVAPEPIARLIRFALLTGLRAGTLRALTWAMVEDREDGPALVLPAAVMKARRDEVLPLAAAARAVLGSRDAGRVFPRVHSYELSRTFSRLVKEAGLRPELTFHSLRKTFATRLLDRNVPVHTVMHLGCWRSAEVLLRYYAARSALSSSRALLADALA